MGDRVNEAAEGSYNDELTPGGFNPLSEEIVEYILKSCNRSSNNSHGLNIDKNSIELPHQLQKCLAILSLPPRYTTVRVNLQKISLENAIIAVESYIDAQYQQRWEKKQKLLVYPHTSIRDLIAIESHGLGKKFPTSKEVIVGQICGSAVLRGAEVYAPGVLGATSSLQAGERVAVYVDLDDKCLRGSKTYKGRKMFIGNGTAVQGRYEIFRVSKPIGVAVTMDEKVFDCPSLRDLPGDVFFLQNLPSILCSHVLDPGKNDVVLDMCAAPGGKSTHLASLLGISGRVIAVDRSQRKVSQIIENAKKLSLTNISAFVYDSTKLVCEDSTKLVREDGTELVCDDGAKLVCESSIKLVCVDSKPNPENFKFSDSSCEKNYLDVFQEYPHPPYPPSSFKWIMLDAPCSALGQRPQIQTKCTMKELNSFPKIQRKLLENAVKLLRLGGKLVYSTCTIVAEENEKMVKWLLDNFDDMELIDSQPKIGQSGLINCGLNFDQCEKVQRFGPDLNNVKDCHAIHNSVDRDTIGFFIAAFRKIR